jgi:dihydrolipoamide dehydrogenase
VPDRTYDLVVIGSGPVGENVADRAHRGGASVAIVEAERVGGECSFWACIPSKALLRPPQALAAARAVAGSRQAVTGDLDVAAVLGRRDDQVNHYDDSGQVGWLESAGIDLVRGHGRLDGPHRVVVTPPDGGEPIVLGAGAVALCTGTRAAVPPVPGLAEAAPWTSREATAATSVPDRLAVVGGGVVACEMATVFAALGSAVTIVQRGPRVLAGVAPFASDAVAASLRDALGVEVVTSATLGSVERRPDGTVALTLTDRVVEADEVLVATGRRPSTDDLGLETVGLAPGGWIDVDDGLEVTGVDGGWLYAAGDVNHRVLLTHMGKYQARACGDLIAARLAGTADDAEALAPWGRFRATADHTAVPQVIFTMPEVAAVGLTADQARERGLDVVTSQYDIGAVAGAGLHADDYAGRAEVVVDAERRVIVGMTLVGPDVGEMIHAATIAVVGEVPLDRLWHAVPSFPTVSELWLRLLEQLGC